VVIKIHRYYLWEAIFEAKDLLSARNHVGYCGRQNNVCLHLPLTCFMSNVWNMLLLPYIAKGIYTCDQMEAPEMGILTWIIQMGPL
jgi:hypothetical protein